jgi:hypothetical protein
MGPEDLKWLASCPLLSTVKSLTFLDSEISTGLPNLLKSAHAAQLEALRMPLHTLGNGAASKLAKSTLARLAVLQLSSGVRESYSYSGRSTAGSMTMRAALELAAWSGLAKIRSLDVSHAKLGRQGLTALLLSPHAKALESLSVRDVPDGDWDMDDSLAAFESGPASKLVELDIGDNDLDPDGARALAESKALAELKVLRADQMRSKSFDRLAQARWIDSLRVLICGESALGPIAKRSPKQLHTISVIAEGPVVRDIVKLLAQAPLPALTTLDLSGTRMGDEGLRKLGQIDTLPNLAAVLLAPRGRATRTTTFSDAAAEEFAASPLGKRVRCLHTGFADVDRLAPAPLIEIGDGEYEGPLRYL